MYTCQSHHAAAIRDGCYECEIEKLRAELAAAKLPDCRTCRHYYTIEESCFLQRRNPPVVCTNGDAYVDHNAPERLYVIDAAANEMGESK